MFIQLSDIMYLEKVVDVELNKLNDMQYISACTIGRCKPFLDTHKVNKAYVIPVFDGKELLIFLSLIEDENLFETVIQQFIPGFKYTGHCTLEKYEKIVDSLEELEDNLEDEFDDEVTADEFIEVDINELLDKLMSTEDGPIVYKYKDICSAFTFVDQLSKDLYFELKIFKLNNQFYVAILCMDEDRESIKLHAFEFFGEPSTVCYPFLEEHAEEIITMS